MTAGDTPMTVENRRATVEEATTAVEVVDA